MKKAKGDKAAGRRRPVGAGLGATGVVREGAAPAQLPDESDLYYQWFQLYWREGAAISLRELSRRVGAKSPQVSDARYRFQWDARIEAWIAEPPEVKRGWVARREALREAEWKLHAECLEAGREALRKWRESGRTANLGDIVKPLELGTKLARMAAGMPENHLMITGEEGEPIRVQFEAALAQAYGPVVDVASEVVEAETERCLNGKRNREAVEVRGEIEAVEAGAAGGAPVPGTGPGAVRAPGEAGGVAGEGDQGPRVEGAAT